MARYLNTLSQAGNKNGKAISGATLTFTETGTSTFLATFQDEALTIDNKNPVVADGQGRFPDIWLQSQKYRVVFKDKGGTILDTHEDVTGPIISGADTLENIAEMTALLKSSLLSGEVFEVDGYYISGDGGGGRFEWDGASTATVNGGTIIASGEGGTGRWLRIVNHTLKALAFGFKTDASANDTMMTGFLASDENVLIFEGGSTYTFASGIIAVDDKSLLSDSLDRAIFDFTGVFATEDFLISATTIDSFKMTGIKVVGGLTELNLDGFDKYGVNLVAATNCHIDNCEADGCEGGIFYRGGSQDSSITNSEANDCYLRGIGAVGTSGSPCVRITITGNKADSTTTTAVNAPFDGIRTEEVYDSLIENNKGTNVQVGVRIENSCDNTVTGNHGWENWKIGMGIYNASQRNAITSNHLFDNNKENQDNTNQDASKSNVNTNFSGINVENNSANNVITGNFCFQTPATTIPFTSGSDEPVLGSLLTGTTSGLTGRVRRIDLDSGSFGGGDATGTFHMVDVTSAWNASEIIQNSTTAVPFDSGSDEPVLGDTIVGSVSGASGTLLWASQQTGSFGVSNAEGVLYLTGVTGTFNGAEDLNNTTQSETNFATNNAAETAADTDIATTNGATTLGTSKGFQKFGIGINVRNLPAMTQADTYNIVTNNQCFNNDLGQVEDRGFYNIEGNNSDLKSNIIRNA